MACHVVYYYCAVWRSSWQNRNNRQYLARSLTRSHLASIEAPNVAAKWLEIVLRICTGVTDVDISACGRISWQGFSQTLRADSGIGPQITPRSLLSTPLAVPLHYLLTIIQFDALQYGLLTESYKNTRTLYYN